MTGSNPPRQNEGDRPRTLGQSAPAIDTSTLFGGRREVVLIHNGEPYRLRLTHSGKLILTK